MKRNWTKSRSTLCIIGASARPPVTHPPVQLLSVMFEGCQGMSWIGHPWLPRGARHAWSCTLRKLYFLSYWMGYDHGDSFPFDFEPNGIPFGSKSKGKLSPRSYPIQFERKRNTSNLSVGQKESAAGSARNTPPCVGSVRWRHLCCGGRDGNCRNLAPGKKISVSG